MAIVSPATSMVNTRRSQAGAQKQQLLTFTHTSVQTGAGTVHVDGAGAYKTS